MTMWLALAFSVHALGCASMDGGGSYASSGDEAFASYVSPDGDTQHGGVQAGTLTAGVWDDNLNPELFEAYRQEVLQAASGALPDYSEAERAAALDHAAPAPRVTLEVALVVDATGSMGDELEYLKAELRSIAETVAETHPNATPRWALVAYRDEGDAYVTQRFDFAGLEAMHRHLRDQVAGGGGDYPEAADRALADAATLSWSTDDSTARLLFWVADAPHHDEDTQALEAAVRALRDQDVRIYPVAASGVGDTAEWTMRSAAQVTRGRYLFLTDDSGVGLSHAEPRVPCYFVTKLNTAMVRMIDIELGGSYLPPAADTLVRETGTIVDGVCFENQVPVATAY
jgi:hypothetical protein